MSENCAIEELCNRLQEHNCDRVDIPKVQQVKNVTAPAESESDFKFEFITNEGLPTSSATAVADVEQVTVKVTGQAYQEENYEWDEQESDYFDVFYHPKVKPTLDFPKLKHDMPQWLKNKEHGATQIYNSEKTKKIDKRHKLLPEIIFDASTTAILERFIENRYLGRYNDVIGRGKNSIVFHANRHRNVCIGMPDDVAVKVYKVGSNEDYNKLVYKRVQREFEHLNILTEYEKWQEPFVNCPWPIKASGNVIIMSYSGLNQKIQDLPHEQDRAMFHRIINLIDKCYNEKHLVHGNLSPKNILCGYDIYILGWSHSVKSDHPQALSKLMRDCKFIVEFYTKRGVKLKSTTEDVFKKITKVSKISSKLLQFINNNLYEKHDTNPNKSCSPTTPKNNTNGILRFKKKLEKSN